MSAHLTVKFAKHISLERVAGMASSIAAYGNVWPGATDREFSVEVFRVAKLPRLKQRLAEWEPHGFLTWAEVENSN
ncbi:MAG: hypothetical protein ABIO39_00395 [Caulobacteraceae bacterium]